MKTTLSCFALLSLVCSLTAQAAENPELEKLQGRWEAKKTENGQSVTFTMEIKKDKLIFKIQGDFSFYATADLKLEKLGPFKAFTSTNIKGGSSEEDLRPVDDEYSHVYLVDGDTLYLTSNFDKLRERPPTMDTYRKLSGGK